MLSRLGREEVPSVVLRDTGEKGAFLCLESTKKCLSMPTLQVHREGTCFPGLSLSFKCSLHIEDMEKEKAL